MAGACELFIGDLPRLLSCESLRLANGRGHVDSEYYPVQYAAFTGAGQRRIIRADRRLCGSGSENAEAQRQSAAVVERVCAKALGVRRSRVALRCRWGMENEQI